MNNQHIIEINQISLEYLIYTKIMFKEYISRDTIIIICDCFLVHLLKLILKHRFCENFKKSYSHYLLLYRCEIQLLFFAYDCSFYFCCFCFLFDLIYFLSPNSNKV